MRYTRSSFQLTSMVRVIAILNDAVGILMAGAYADRASLVGMGLGMSLRSQDLHSPRCI